MEEVINSKKRYNLGEDKDLKTKELGEKERVMRGAVMNGCDGMEAMLKGVKGW